MPGPHLRAAHEAAVRRYETRAVERLARAGRPVYCGGRHGNEVALTFDDGPGPYTAATLRLLQGSKARATFFLVGRQIAPYRSLVRVENRRGALGDHTWSHAWLTALPHRAVFGQIGWTRTAIRRTTGSRVRLFRPPYEAHSPAIDRVVRLFGMVEVLWDVDSRDSEGATWRRISRNVIQALRPGAIILLHENHRRTLMALNRRILPALRHRGLRSVGLPELLADDPPSRAQLALGWRGCPPPGRELPG